MIDLLLCGGPTHRKPVVAAAFAVGRVCSLFRSVGIGSMAGGRSTTSRGLIASRVPQPPGTPPARAATTQPLIFPGLAARPIASNPRADRGPPAGGRLSIRQDAAAG